MSGRSAFVRKEKETVKTATSHVGIRQQHHGFGPAYDYPAPSIHKPEPEFGYELPVDPYTRSVISSDGSGEYAYRVHRPHIPNLDVSGIEKSTFREKMDKKSETVRKGLLSTFRKKKEKSVSDESRSPSSIATRTPIPSGNEEPLPDFNPPRLRAMTKQERLMQEQAGEQETHHAEAPLKKLPSLPPAPQIKRWLGNGRPVQAWNKLRKDPELWDPNGDTLVILGQDTHPSERPPPSFRVSSHVLEATESNFFIQVLRDGCLDFSHGLDRTGLPFPLREANGRSESSDRQNRTAGGFGGQLNSLDSDASPSYEIFFPPPLNANKVEMLRHNITTRNVFALLYQASLVGLNFSQTLIDLQKRLQQYMPHETDSAGLIMGLDDVRNDCDAAVALLVWSENPEVQWQRGWREAFVHATGMQSKIENTSEFRHISTFTRALLERASLEVQVRVNSVEERLKDFDFIEMWPPITSISLTTERAAFERLQQFFKGYYGATYGSWPVEARRGQEQWLTRGIVQKLQKDFGALYDCLVDREALWDASEGRASRKWMIHHANSIMALNVDTESLPMTDILVGFDNRHRFPHIPHPYPLVPDTMPELIPKENIFKASRKHGGTVVEDQMAKRKVALAYTEASNIYTLGSDFQPNHFVDTFLRFEKDDMSGTIDPALARRGRWVLIYGILQTLASVSVDTPGIRYVHNVDYYLNPRLRGTPPWKGPKNHTVEATHEGSHCWTIPKTWTSDETIELEAPMPLTSGRPLRSDQRSTYPSIDPLPELQPAALVSTTKRDKYGIFPAPPSPAATVSGEGEFRFQPSYPINTQPASRTKHRKAQRPSNRSSLATSTEAEDEVPALEPSSSFRSPRQGALSMRSPTAASFSENETGSSVRGPVTLRRPQRGHTRTTEDASDRSAVDEDYKSGFEAVDDWPVRTSGLNRSSSKSTIIKDFDEFKFLEI